MELFKTFERMILTDLRPNLSVYETKEGLEKLETEFYSFEYDKSQDPSLFIANLLIVRPDLMPGDPIKLELNEETNKISVSRDPNPDEEELINLDIAPPPDEKGEIFLQIIEHEYIRIKRAFETTLVRSATLEELRFSVLKIITKAKQLASEAHKFEKRLSSSNSLIGQSSQYIVRILKIYLIYSILEVQRVFRSVLNRDIQSKDSLEDELYEFSASKNKALCEKVSRGLNEKHLVRLHAQFSADDKLIDKINFFKRKAEDKIKLLDSQLLISKFDIDERDLYLEEFGKLTALYYDQQLVANEAIMTYKQILEFLLKTEAKLSSDKKSLQFQALQKTNFLFRLLKRIELLRELVAVDPKAHGLGLLGDISTLAMLIQGRAWIQQENHFNDYLADLLRAKRYEVSDQTRNGMSTAQKGSGSLDIAIRDSSKNGTIISIIESFILKSCGPKNKTVSSHLRKLTNLYDSAGNKENFAVVVARTSDFEGLWKSYKKHVDKVVFDDNYTTVDHHLEWVSFDKVKIGLTEFNQDQRAKRLFHIFLNMFNPETVEFQPVTN